MLKACNSTDNNKDEVKQLKDDKVIKVKDYARDLLKYKKKADKLPFS